MALGSGRLLKLDGDKPILPQKSLVKYIPGLSQILRASVHENPGFSKEFHGSFNYLLTKLEGQAQWPKIADS